MTKERPKKIAVVTGSRAEYGLLKRLLSLISKEKTLDLKLIATGAHLEKRFGYTLKEIINDGLKVDEKIKVHINRQEHVNETISRAIKLISKTLKKIKPDYVILLGDRYEILSAAISSFFLNIPIIHIHGGEKTLGSFDDVIRHSITKMSYIHFVAAKEYKNRVVQLGENPKRVYEVGGLGVDVIKNIRFLRKKELAELLSINFNKKNILVTIHPETSGNIGSEYLINQILEELEKLKDTNLFFTEANTDPGGSLINKKIDNFVRKDSQGRFLFKSLGIKNYLSLAKNMDLVLGNSSSGLIEIPYLKVPTLNIGSRQEGRLRASSVYDCNVVSNQIGTSLKKMLKDGFLNTVSFQEKPYGNGGASEKILKVIMRVDVPDSIKKDFFDL